MSEEVNLPMKGRSLLSRVQELDANHQLIYRSWLNKV